MLGGAGGPCLLARFDYEYFDYYYSPGLLCSANGSVPLPFAGAFHKRVRSTNGSGTLPFVERAQCIPQTGAFHKRKCGARHCPLLI